MKIVTLTEDEAQRVVHALRNVQMGLGQLERAAGPVMRDHYLFSNEFAGELEALATGVEGSIFEAGVVGLPDDAGEQFRGALPSDN